MDFPFFSRRILIAGEICRIQLLVEAVESGEDARLWELSKEIRKKIDEQIRQTVNEDLGPEFEAQVLYYPGSLTIIVVISTAAVLYYAISRYKGFIESLQLMAVHLNSLLSRILGHHVRSGLSVQVVSVSPTLPMPPSATYSPDLASMLNAALWYLILSHGLLLLALVWMLVRR